MRIVPLFSISISFFIKLATRYSIRITRISWNRVCKRRPPRAVSFELNLSSLLFEKVVYSPGIVTIAGGDRIWGRTGGLENARNCFYGFAMRMFSILSDFDILSLSLFLNFSIDFSKTKLTESLINSFNGRVHINLQICWITNLLLLLLLLYDYE